MIQARNASTRFPKKMIAKIEGYPMLWHVINRTKLVKNVDRIILATTKKDQDTSLIKIAQNHNIMTFRGNSKDVLGRYYQCALKNKARIIVRITGDCPLTDPDIITKMIKFYKRNNYEYISNTLKLSFPDGMDVEIFSFEKLKNANRFAKLPSEREHVTPYIIKHTRKKFNYKNKIDLSHIRLTIDEKKDLELVRRIYSKMRPSLIFGINQILKIILQNPTFLEINKGIKRNEGYIISLKKDLLMKKKSF